MGISFRDFMESDSHSSFQVFVNSLDEDIALLETVTSLGNYRDNLNMLEYVAHTHGSQYPSQEFFKEEADRGYKVLTLCDGSGELSLPGFYSDEVELIESDDLDNLVFDADLLGLEDLS